MRRSQRGRGPRWDKFKSFLGRAWGKIAPAAMSAGKKAMPHVLGIAMSKHGADHKKKAALGLAKKFGSDVVRSLVR